MIGFLSKRSGARAALASSLVTLAFACAGHSAVAQEKTVYLQKYSDARNFDPHKLITRSVSEILSFVTDTLVSIDDDLTTVRDGLAKEWKVSPDGLTYTFTLKDKLKFCDGKPITAQVVEANFKRWRDPATKSINTVLLGPLQSVSASNATTVVFKLGEPSDQFLTSLASPYAGIIDAEEAQRMGDQFAVAGMNGSGPYCWDNWRPRDQISLKKNPNYTWGSGVYKNKGPVSVDKVVIKIMPEENSRVAAMLTGQSDASYYVPWTSIAQFRKDPNFAIVEPRAFGYLAYIGTKVHRPLMTPEVRHAMNLAIDREGLVAAMYDGQANVAPFVVSPDFAGFNKALVPNAPRYDVKLANKILDDAGWVRGKDGIRVKNGVRLAPVMLGHNPWRQRLEAIQGMLREIGIDVQLDITDTPIATSRILTKSDYDMYGWYASYGNVGELMQKYFLPTEPYSPHRAVQEQGKELSQLILGASKEIDPAKRAALYNQAQKLIAENDYWLPLVHERMLVVYNKKKLAGVKPHGLNAGGFYKGIDFSIPGK